MLQGIIGLHGVPFFIYTHFRLYFGEHNVTGMFNVLEPLHQKMEKGPETLKEISFNQVPN